MADYFYNAIRRDIVMIKNDTLSFGFQVQGLEGQIPSNIVFTCKETPESAKALFTVSLANHIQERSYDSETDIRTYVLRIPPELTEKVELGRYFYDIQFTVNYDILTLMIGRLTVSYQVTGGSVDPTPDYENGDNVKYPLIGIPSGTIKLYTEQWISDIGEAINLITGSNDTYTTREMSDALSNIKNDIDDIGDAINDVIGGTGDIPLSQMSLLIEGLANLDTFIDNVGDILANIQGWSNYNLWVYLVDSTHYFVLIFKDPIKIGFKFLSTRGDLFFTCWWSTTNGLAHESYFIWATSDISTGLAATGRENFYPIDSTEGALSIYLDEITDLTSAAFYTRPNRYGTLDNDNINLVKTYWGDGEYHIFSDFASRVKIGDIFNITNSGMTNAYLIFIPDWERYISLLAIDNNSNRIVYNRSEGKIYIYKCYWYNLTDDVYWTKTNITLRESGHDQYVYSITEAALRNAIILNSIDILDENGNIVIAANCTASDFEL